MKKRSKTKVISILTILAVLLSTCFMFASCNGGGEQTLKYNITITGENGEVLCNLTDATITGTDLTIIDATQRACEVIELTLGLDEAGDFVEQIGELKNGVQGEAPEETAEPQTDENGEEIPAETQAQDYYFWEVSVNSSILETGPHEYKISDGDTISWKWVLFDESAS